MFREEFFVDVFLSPYLNDSQTINYYKENVANALMRSRSCTRS